MKLNKYMTHKEKIITGQIIPTNEYIDGKQVYVKRIDCGPLLNNASKFIDIGIDQSTINLVNLYGSARDIAEGFWFTLPLVSVDAPIIVYLSGKSLVIRTTSNRTSLTQSYIKIYFTYN